MWVKGERDPGNSSEMTYALKPTSDARERPVLLPGLSERAALEDLRRRLVRYAVKLIWNRDDAEELVQEALQLAIAKQIALRDERFGPWAFRTVGNLALNLRRRSKREPLGGWIEPAAGESPEGRMERIEELERVRAAISALPDQQRIAIVLRMEQQMDYADIAGIMELSESAVRGHVHQARRSLIAACTHDGHPKGGDE